MKYNDDVLVQENGESRTVGGNGENNRAPNPGIEQRKYNDNVLKNETEDVHWHGLLAPRGKK